MMQQSVFAPLPTSVRNAAPRSSSIRPVLPGRNVTSETIEDTYVQFILYCNPAVPPDTDTTILREAFQTPPKSGGKTFDTFLLFELIKLLDAKELKTWAELALKLGVEPPDQDKGQSSQKIQQYAVRLKRWMHSMHVDAFFEYLLDRPNGYWTDVPRDQNPVCESGRDGVAAEDDMALRSLLPHIRPRRGRRKPEDDEATKSPSQRPSMEPPPMGDDLASAHPMSVGAWSAHPDTRGSVFLFPTSEPLRLGSGTAQASGLPWAAQNDTLQTPMTAHPQSAITPSTRQAFWADEPKSAITPSRAKIHKRHGAKVVSSAWRSGLGGTGKTRGRPRLNRDGNQDGPFSAFPSSEVPTFSIPMQAPPMQPQEPAPGPPQQATTTGPPNLTLVTSPTAIQPPSGPTTPVINSPTPTGPHLAQNPRPAKRSRLSLQVPERVGGEVRLASPPAAIAVTGHSPTPVDYHHLQQSLSTAGSTTSPVKPPQAALPAGHAVPQSSSAPAHPSPPPPPPFQHPQTGGVHFHDPTDRTNIDAIEGFFVGEVLTADWFGPAGNAVPACGVEEAWAITRTVMGDLRKTAPSKDAFLINLAALAGAKLLMRTTNVRMQRVQEGKDEIRYSCSWELRLGDIRSTYSMQATVARKLFEHEEADGEEEGRGGEEERRSAEEWQKKYVAMREALRRKDRELADVRLKVVQALKEPRGDGGKV